MTRVVGNKDRSMFVLDPVEAWHLGRVLDGMLKRALPLHPRGVFRATHAEFNRRDQLRQLDLARLLNSG